MLTNSEKEYAISIINRMKKKHISEVFWDPIDPIKDKALDYNDIIKNPMCLSTVLEKLETSRYSSLELWAKDVDLIWTNAMIFNGPSSLIYLMALELQTWFRKRFYSYNYQYKQTWIHDFHQITEKLQLQFSGLDNSPAVAFE
jgi:hypothetical protein